MLLKLY